MTLGTYNLKEIKTGLCNISIEDVSMQSLGADGMALTQEFCRAGKTLLEELALNAIVHVAKHGTAWCFSM